MKDLAGKMGYTLENNGVKVMLSSPYLPGTARMQALAAADAVSSWRSMTTMASWQSCRSKARATARRRRSIPQTER
jgi:hypothetical protein